MSRRAGLAEEARDKARSELAHVARVMTLGTLTASIAHETQPAAVRQLSRTPAPVCDAGHGSSKCRGCAGTARRTIRDGNRASEVITRLRALFSKKHAAAESVNLNDAALE